MTNSSTNTIRLHRVLRSTPERVYRAFLEPEALAKWFPPNGFVCKVFEQNPKVGGTYRMAFINFTTGKGEPFGGTYLELNPHSRLRYSARFDDPAFPGEITTTVDLRQVSCGTEVSITQEGVPAVIPAESCYLGWQQSVALLAKLVEAEIPEG